MITIQEETTRNPITLIGKEAGICYNSNTKDDDKNYKRGWNCIKSNHGRTLEFPQIYAVIDKYSAKVIREFYTHIGGLPTRLQASTRYIEYTPNGDSFEYVIPKTIQANDRALDIYTDFMEYAAKKEHELEELGIPKEDASYVYPFAMCTKIVWRTNLRNLLDMEHTRLCSRALWEFRDLMHELNYKLSDYSDEWAKIVDKLFVPKCDICGYCTEAKSCGRKPKLKGDAF